ncbi:uncharacterized protein LOC125219500 isoform X2 [Salvia hispanica]|uniref:uncharacterized protein LOC125219500 isoform X2 n=1 Tax=Salvia hispanica TaxID=49212 RepID=UPI002008FE41|nr:uncharacterized protein LOC125219500 isoform X2 [Salvia hispanica]
MSENGKHELLHHIVDEHPLIRTQAVTNSEICYACEMQILNGETIYECSEKCRPGMYLHEGCAEMPREICHTLHPQHTLVQQRLGFYPFPSCLACGGIITEIAYSCGSCDFQIHVKCAHSMDMVGEASFTKHPSHPQHHLKLLQKPGLRCDACGVVHPGNSYICTVCDYCINESCAALGPTMNRLLHDHPLSLAYRLPLEYIDYRFRYVVHLNCATISHSPFVKSNNDGNVLALPTNDVAGDVIGGFIKKLGVRVICNDNELVKGKYKLHNHDHQLRLISASLHDDEEEDEEENKDDDDDVEDDAELVQCGSLIVCDGCTDPISWWSNYISCGDCNFFLHLACFRLPAELRRPPLHPDHILTLQMCPKLSSVCCSACTLCTNGLFYRCTNCDFQADIKCVSLPHTIKYTAHPHHLYLYSPERVWTLMFLARVCSACGDDPHYHPCYRCDVCQISFDFKCVLLPLQVNNRRWDKHPLPLTFDATANHPSDFYCEVCETKMHPRSRMYHCRDCDASIHPWCLPTVSGEYRNFKFGQRCDVGALHQPPVVHRLTNKLHCSICWKKVYRTTGFQCASQNCDFFLCSYRCQYKNSIRAID